MTTLTAATPTPPPATWSAPPRRPAQAAAWGFTAGDLLRVVRQRLVMVVFMWLLIVGLTIGITAYWIRYYPEFRAEALILVESMRPGDPIEDQRAQRVDVEGQEMLVKNQAVFVTSPDVLDKALTDPGVKDTSWHKELMARGDPNLSLIDELKDILTATPVPGSGFLLISVRGKVPGELPMIANAIVNKYVERVNEMSKSRYREEIDRLKSEVDRSKTLLNTKNTEIERFRLESPAAVFTQGGGNIVSDELMTLNAIRVELEMQKLGRKQIWETLRNAGDQAPITAEMQAALAADPELYRMRQSIDQLRDARDTLMATLGPNHRTVRNYDSQIEALRTRLTAGEADKIANFKGLQLQMAERDYLTAQEQELAIAERVEIATTKQRDLDQRFGRYLQLLEERELLKAGYESLLGQLDLLNMTVRREKTVQIQVASYAQPPKRRSSPKWLINIPIGIIVGLMSAVGLAVLLELADTSVRTPRDVIRHIAIPVLGTIPSVDDEEVEIQRVELVTVEAPHSIMAEAFRQLRTNLFFSAPVEHQSVLLVSSTGAGDGKTAVAVNLAAAMAISGRRVLLIDSNFRRPALRSIFPGMRPEGLSNVLIGQSRLADVVTPSSIPALDLLSTGPTPPNPAELLGSSYLRDLIADARSRYDQIIFDGPPVLLVSDALVLSGAVDGVVLVCRFRTTSRGALQRARTQLEAINARILGAVLNAVQTTRGGYFRKQYRAFYDYQREEEVLEAPKLPGEQPAAAQAPADEAGEIGDDLAAIAPDSAGEPSSDEPRRPPDDPPDGC